MSIIVPILIGFTLGFIVVLIRRVTLKPRCYICERKNVSYSFTLCKEGSYRYCDACAVAYLCIICQGYKEWGEMFCKQCKPLHCGYPLGGENYCLREKTPDKTYCSHHIGYICPVCEQSGKELTDTMCRNCAIKNYWDTHCPKCYAEKRPDEDMCLKCYPSYHCPKCNTEKNLEQWLCSNCAPNFCEADKNAKPCGNAKRPDWTEPL